MHVEIQEAVSFLGSFLYGKVPRRKVDLLVERFANSLVVKYREHWDAAEPSRDACYRRIEVNLHGRTDSLLFEAANSIGLNLDELLAYLPAEMTVFVNPTEVSYRLGGSTALSSVFSALEGVSFMSGCYGQEQERVLPVLRVTTAPPVDDKYRPGGQAFELLPRDGDVVYTVGTFALTRFGSTRPKAPPAGRADPPPPPPQQQTGFSQQTNALYYESTATWWSNDK